MLQKAQTAKENTTEGEIEEEIRLAWNKVYSDAYLKNYTAEQKTNALKTELEDNKPSETAIADPYNLTVEYRGKTIEINEITGDINIKKALPKINAGEKAPENSNAEYKSENYTAIIPAGFTVSNVEGEKSINTGLVIRDDDGNEFVWIPINIPYITDSSKTIELGRYEFKKSNDSTAGSIVQKKTDGSTLRPEGSSYDYIEESPRETGSNQNAVAKNINDFIKKTKLAGGFWIGRYEARVEGYSNVVTSNSNSDTNWTGYIGGKLVEKPEAHIFNYITQNKASELSKNMYGSNDYFESDLINSFAWDTATLFLQEYDNRADAVKENSNYKSKYSVQIRLSGGIKNKGTNAPTVAEIYTDKICNVYDMAENCFEWTTETYEYSSRPVVLRGGYYDGNDKCTGERINYKIATGYADRSFRPIIYIK